MSDTIGLVLLDEAISKLEASNEGLIQKAVEYVRFAAPRLMTFTTDDLFEPDEWAFTDSRAIGAVMQRAQKLGYIKATDDWRRSTRAKCHGRPKRVWQHNPRTPENP